MVLEEQQPEPTSVCMYVCTHARETAHTTTYTNNIEERLTKSEIETINLFRVFNCNLTCLVVNI